tara:strand:- start:30 stop:800 length:771 start_codon:yes stop_codon:yes gene_type:complete
MRKTKLSDFSEAIKNYDLPKDVIINIHSSLLRFGIIENGLPGLMECLEDVLGADATIVMPAYTYSSFPNTREWYSKTTKSQCGALTEYFRKRQGVKRTLHPFHSVCVKGKFRKQFLECTNISSFGPGSPFDVLVQMDAFNLILGGEFIGGGTFTHHTEEICKVPYRFYKKFPGKVYDHEDKIVNKTFEQFARIITDDYEYRSVRKGVFDEMKEYFTIQEINCVQIYLSDIKKTHYELQKRILNDPYYAATRVGNNL